MFACVVNGMRHHVLSFFFGDSNWGIFTTQRIQVYYFTLGSMFIWRSGLIMTLNFVLFTTIKTWCTDL
jgi:hypothetical protein